MPVRYFDDMDIENTEFLVKKPHQAILFHEHACTCGNCGETLDPAALPTQCPNEACSIAWRYAIGSNGEEFSLSNRHIVHVEASRHHHDNPLYVDGCRYLGRRVIETVTISQSSQKLL